MKTVLEMYDFFRFFLRAKFYFILVRKWVIYGLIIRKMKTALEMYDFFRFFLRAKFYFILVRNEC